jgi:exodeoxyribonuclease-5
MIIIGDHGQLEPINSQFNIMSDPDYTLEEIHRNAGDIAKFAEHLRFGKNARKFSETDCVQFKNQRNLTAEDLIEADQVICAYNRTRVETNNIIREALGHQGVLNVGERVMCLRNNKTNGLFNGMQGTVKSLYEDVHGRKYMDFESNDTVYESVWYDCRYFGQDKPEIFYQGRDSPNPFDYAYCATAHKCQGDEWNKVLVIEQKCKKWDHKRWAYTSASRAKQQLIWAY